MFLWQRPVQAHRTYIPNGHIQMGKCTVWIYNAVECVISQSFICAQKRFVASVVLLQPPAGGNRRLRNLLELAKHTTQVLSCSVHMDKKSVMVKGHWSFGAQKHYRVTQWIEFNTYALTPIVWGASSGTGLDNGCKQRRKTARNSNQSIIRTVFRGEITLRARDSPLLRIQSLPYQTLGV